LQREVGKLIAKNKEGWATLDGSKSTKISSPMWLSSEGFLTKNKDLFKIAKKWLKWNQNLALHNEALEKTL